METTTKTTYDWDFIMTDSDYNISLKLLEVYNNGDYEELGKALKAYKESSVSDAKLELYEELSELITLIFLWTSDNSFQTEENRIKILRHRDEIDSLREEYNFIDDDFIKNEWNDSYQSAKKIASSYITNIFDVEWNDVFITDFKSKQ